MFSQVEPALRLKCLDQGHNRGHNTVRTMGFETMDGAPPIAVYTRKKCYSNMEWNTGC